MLPPLFVKGHLTFSLEGHTLEFMNQNISTFGVMGLKWHPLNAQDHFGATVQTVITCPAKEAPLMIKTDGHLIRELTVQADYMGVQLHLNDEQRKLLQEYIRAHGFYPTDYIRKHPRIPANKDIQTFPMRVLGTLKSSSGDTAPPMVFDVANLSPNGILINSENQSAKTIRVGDYINMTLEPRGWFPTAIKVQGLICRITDNLDKNSSNFTRSFGIKFTKVDETNRNAFLDLLRDILEKVKTQP
jgi:hypothetical protein